VKKDWKNAAVFSVAWVASTISGNGGLFCCAYTGFTVNDPIAMAVPSAMTLDFIIVSWVGVSDTAVFWIAGDLRTPAAVRMGANTLWVFSPLRSRGAPTRVQGHPQFF
jgi:hypothetical protein